MKLLSKISLKLSLVTLMAIAPLAHAAKQDVKSAPFAGISTTARIGIGTMPKASEAALQALGADISKINRDVFGEKILFSQRDEYRKKRLTEFVKDIEQGKIPRMAANYYMTVSLDGADRYLDYTPLLEATWMQDLDLIKRLIDLGAQPDLPIKSRGNNNMDGETPLMWASGYGNRSIVTELLKKTKNINQTDTKGETALSHAALNSQAEIVQLLLDAGADVSIRNKDGQTILDFMYQNRESRLYGYDNDKEIIRLLEQAQAKQTN